jgi:hypothetical protein
MYWTYNSVGPSDTRPWSEEPIARAEQRREYYMGEGGGFPRVRAVVSQMSPCCLWLVPTPRVISIVN